MAVMEWADDLDADAVCDAVAVRHTAVLETEAELFFLAARWADLHRGDALDEYRRRSGRLVLPGMERARRLGADGTPTVAEFAPAELGALQGLGHIAAAHLVRDALNVRHRHPLLWVAIGEGTVRVWQARKTAQACAEAGLDAAQARAVDEATTPFLPLLPWSRFLTLLQAKIVAADPAAAEERRLAAAMARFVRTGQSTEHGLKTLVARATAGDVIYFVAMVDRIATILLEHGDADPADVRRSKAIGILATPARALHLLQTSAAAAARAHAADQATPDESHDGNSDGHGHGHDDGDSGGDEPGLFDATPEDPDVVAEADVHPAHRDTDPTTRATAGHGAGHLLGDPAAFLAAFAAVDPRKLLPDATLYIHLTQDMLRTPGRGVARFEGVGPVTGQQVVDLLGHSNVRVVPVLDLTGQTPVDGYEVPARMAEALYLRNPACVFPWSSNLSRRKDKDHTRPYLPPDKGGPPGQTRMDNLGYLARFPHRLKTHGRWRLHQTRPGVYEWRSPHGYWYRVDHTGTHPLGRNQHRDLHHRLHPDQDTSQPSAQERRAFPIELRSFPFPLHIQPTP